MVEVTPERLIELLRKVPDTAARRLVFVDPLTDATYSRMLVEMARFGLEAVAKVDDHELVIFGRKHVTASFAAVASTCSPKSNWA